MSEVQGAAVHPDITVTLVSSAHVWMVVKTHNSRFMGIHYCHWNQKVPRRDGEDGTVRAHPSLLLPLGKAATWEPARF